MKNPAAARAVILVVELLTFLLGTAALAYFISYASAVEPAPDEPLPTQFPVIVYEGQGKTAARGYRVMSWKEWEKQAAALPEATFLLPERSGRIELGSGTYAAFESAPESAERQAIGLRWRTADGERVSRYLAQARSIEPRYFRVLASDTLLTSAVAAFVLSFFLGRALRSRWLTRGYFS